MKSANCISAIGRRPTTAAPTAVPMIPDSARGVSITRSSPNSSTNPSVTLKAPPNTPMSSPITSTRSSWRISWRMASEMACRYVMVGMSGSRRGGREAAPRRVAVAEQHVLLALVEGALGRRGRIGHRHLQRLLGGLLDRLAHLGPHGVGVGAEPPQARLLALDGVLLAPLLDLLLGHVLHVVVRGVAVHAHRQGLDQRGAAVVERALARLARGLEHRLGVVAVDAQAREAVGLGALDRVDRELVVERRGVRVLV